MTKGDRASAVPATGSMWWWTGFAYTPEDIERDHGSSATGPTSSSFISSASGLQETASAIWIHSRDTRSANPFLGLLAEQDRLRGAPDAGVPRRTGSRSRIVRPSLTYGDTQVHSRVNKAGKGLHGDAEDAGGKPLILPGRRHGRSGRSPQQRFCVGFVGPAGRRGAIGLLNIMSDEVLTWTRSIADRCPAAGVKRESSTSLPDFIAACLPEWSGSAPGRQVRERRLRHQPRSKRFVPDSAP